MRESLEPMEFVREFFSDRFYVIVVLLVIMDVALIACFVLLWKRRSVLPEGSEDLKQNLQALVDDMNGLATGLSANLEERVNILQRMVKGLDEKIADGERLVKSLKELEGRISSQVSETTVYQRGREARQVVALSGKGLDVQAIAQKLQKPVGEVELILNLEKLARKKL